MIPLLSYLLFSLSTMLAYNISPPYPYPHTHTHTPTHPHTHCFITSDMDKLKKILIDAYLRLGNAQIEYYNNKPISQGCHITHPTYITVYSSYLTHSSLKIYIYIYILVFSIEPYYQSIGIVSV